LSNVKKNTGRAADLLGDVGDVFDPDVERFSVRMQLLKQVFVDMQVLVDMDLVDNMHKIDDMDADDMDAALGGHLECAHSARFAQVSSLRERKKERERERERERESKKERERKRERACDVARERGRAM